MPRKPVNAPANDAEEKPKRGRKFGDPNSKRSYRYVMRMHPDLADALGEMADEAGMSRALFVERVLISFVNHDPRHRLNHIGRKVTIAPPPGERTVGSLASFGRQWQRWQHLHQDVIGEELPADPYRGAAIDDYGGDERGHPVTTGPRPPMPYPKIKSVPQARGPRKKT